MVSQRDLNAVVTQVNSSYAVMVERIAKLEAQVAALSTKRKESKEKS